MESFNQVNGYHPDSHSIQYQIREQSNAKEDVGGNQGNCSTENENNVIGTMQEIQICSINKKSNVDQNCISRNVQVAHRFNWNSCISRNIEMTDWFSQKSESSNLLLDTWPKPHPPSAINKPSNCSSDCTKLRQKLLDIRNKEYALSDKYLNLEILYGKKCEELVQQKQEEFKQRGLAEAKIQALMSANEFLQVERHKLSSRLQVADRLVTNIRRENNILRERLKTIAPQKSRNEENQFTQVQQFQSNQTHLKAITQQANELKEFCSYLLRQRDHLVQDFEFQHEKKVNHLKKEMDELQRLLNSKTQVQQFQSNQTHLKAITQKANELEEYCSHLLKQRDHLVKDFEFQHEKKVNHWKKEMDELQRLLNSKEKADINKIKRDHEIELAAIKNQYESKILDLEKEIEILKINLSQIEEEKNNFKELNDVLLEQREAWNKEQNEYQKTKLTLQEKIKAAEELEAKLQEKINKYESRLAVMEREHQEEISKLQLQIFGLTKSGCHKENKTGEMVPTERSLKTQNILKCLKQTEQIKVIEYNSENMERSSRNPNPYIMKQRLKIPGYVRK